MQLFSRRRRTVFNASLVKSRPGASLKKVGGSGLGDYCRTLLAMLHNSRRKLVALHEKENALTERLNATEGRLAHVIQTLKNLQSILRKEAGNRPVPVTHNVVSLHIFIDRKQVAGKLILRLYSESVGDTPLGTLVIATTGSRYIIENIGVAERFRGQGLGRRLLATARDLAGELPLEGRIECSELSSIGYQSFFEPIGFRAWWEEGFLMVSGEGGSGVLPLVGGQRPAS